MKVGIIGAGSVGSAAAFSLMMTGVAHKVVLIDMNEKKAQAEAMDIAHAAPFGHAGKIKAGTYEDLEGCEIVIVTAGANQKPGETRIDLLGRNVKIFESIIPQVAKHAPNSILLITANPADIMTEVARKLSGFPKERVIGSGTVLDTSRFRTLLAFYLGVSTKSVHADVIGEHGDSEVLIWSNAEAGTLSLDEYAASVNKVLDDAKKAEIKDGVVNAAFWYRELRKRNSSFSFRLFFSQIFMPVGTASRILWLSKAKSPDATKEESLCMEMVQPISTPT